MFFPVQWRVAGHCGAHGVLVVATALWGNRPAHDLVQTPLHPTITSSAMDLTSRSGVAIMMGAQVCLNSFLRSFMFSFCLVYEYIVSYNRAYLGNTLQYFLEHYVRILCFLYHFCDGTVC